MGKIRILSAADVRRALPMAAAIEGMKQAYTLYTAGEVEMPLRARVSVAPHGGIALFMPAYISAREDLAVKAVTVFPRNVENGEPAVYGSVLVLDGRSGRPLALLEGSALTAIRTGAGAGAATDLLARPDSRVLAMLGSGVQARAGLEAVCTVRQIEEVRVYSPTPQHARAFAREMAGQGPIPEQIDVVKTPGAAVRGADIVYAATTATTPVFDGRDLKQGAHVNGVGSFTPQMQEVDAHTVLNALVVVDALEAAWEEAGDLIIPLEAGEMAASHVYGELGLIAAGRLEGRTSPEQITFFKSVGLAVQDAVAAGIALQNAERESLGLLVDF